MNLPFQPPVAPMLAGINDDLPAGEGWRYELKWDGFCAIVFFDGTELYIQSRDLRPRGRYFPELVSGLAEVLTTPVVLDGEIVVMTEHGLDFGVLQWRLHPAESRVRMLSVEVPTQFVAFDLLAEDDVDLRGTPSAEHHRRLHAMFPADQPPLYRSPSTNDRALADDWFHRFEGAGFDGIIAKREDEAYLPGECALVKVKHKRTADCVVAGFRWAKNQAGTAVGSLLLGLYDSEVCPPSCRTHLEFQGGGEARPGGDPRPARERGREHRIRWRPDTRYAEPLVAGQGRVLGTIAARARLRGHLRPSAGRPLPTRHDIQAMAPGQAVERVHL